LIKKTTIPVSNGAQPADEQNEGIASISWSLSMRDRRISRALRALSMAAALFAVAGGFAVAQAEAARMATETSTYADTIRDGRIAAKELLKQTGAPSLSLALVKGDSVVWSQGFGYADKAASVRPQASTMYGIGSVSKMLATGADGQAGD